MIELKIWKKPQIDGGAPEGRYGHSTVPYAGQYAIVFGGECGFNAQFKLRKCQNDIQMFNIDTCEWKQLSSNSEVPVRKNHAASRCNEFMYVYGGIDSYGKILKDVWRFNLSIIFSISLLKSIF